jgi:hypothetical protein
MTVTRPEEPTMPNDTLVVERIPVPRRSAEPPAFILTEGFRRDRLDGKDGVVLRVRLTSYRSLPLSCIRQLSLELDGRPVDMSTVTFLLHHQGYRLADLPERIDLWWYILDHAEIFVPAAGLVAGPHRVAGSVTMIMPFATGGRTTLTTSAVVDLSLSTDIVPIDEGTMA